MRMEIKEARELIDLIYQFRLDRLTDWERNFCDDIYESIYPDLTEKQTATLEKTYDRTMR